MKRLKDKRITVMGLGLHGGAVGNVKWLVGQGASVVVTDLKTKEELGTSVDALSGVENVELVLGEHREEDFRNADIVLRNPAVSRDAEFLNIAREAGAFVEMDSSMFFEHSLSSHIIGITGSKGKTTTTHALSVLIPDSVKVGTEGTSVLEALNEIQEDTPVVFELSSWRLEALAEKEMSPRIAVVTSIYREHLNTYDSFEEYIDMKKTVIRFQSENDVALLNYDDEHLREWASEVRGKLYWYSMKELAGGSEGVFVRDGNIVVRAEQREVVICSVSDMQMKSEHEIRNTLPAVLLAWLAGTSKSEITKKLNGLQGLPHRLEFLEEVNGVQYVNDSASTMPDATIAALKSFKGKDIVLILGGNDKELVFENLARQVSGSKVKEIIYLPGNATKKMQDVIGKGKKVLNMKNAVELAKAIAKNGDVVLLSPGATSFHTFKHEFDRGDAFVREVKNISH